MKNKYTKEIAKLNKETEDIVNTALDSVKNSEIKEYQDLLLSAVNKIREVTGYQDTSEQGFLERIVNKLPFLSKGVKKSFIEKYDENITLKESIDVIFESLERSLEATEKDLKTLNKLKNNLESNIEKCNKIIHEIDVEIKTINDEMELNRLNSVQRELKSIVLVNTNTLKQIKSQLMISIGLADQTREIKPILKNLLQTQTLLALQNARLAQANEVRELISETVNEFILKNNNDTQQSILDAIEFAGGTVIKKETIDELGSQNETFIAELNSKTKTLIESKKEFDKTLNNTIKKIEKTKLVKLT